MQCTEGSVTKTEKTIAEKQLFAIVRSFSCNDYVFDDLFGPAWIEARALYMHHIASDEAHE